MLGLVRAFGRALVEPVLSRLKFACVCAKRGICENLALLKYSILRICADSEDFANAMFIGVNFPRNGLCICVGLGR